MSDLENGQSRVFTLSLFLYPNQPICRPFKQVLHQPARSSSTVVHPLNTPRSSIATDALWPALAPALTRRCAHKRIPPRTFLPTLPFSKSTTEASLTPTTGSKLDSLRARPSSTMETRTFPSTRVTRTPSLVSQRNVPPSALPSDSMPDL